MEAALRTAYYFLNHKDLDNDKLLFQGVRGIKGVKSLEVDLGEVSLKVAVVNGLKNVSSLLDKLKKGEVYFDFIEVMSCDFGCVGGGGQPKLTLLEMKERKQKRLDSIEKEDEESKIRLCHRNPEIVEVYDKFLERPYSIKAQGLLHTSFQDKSYLLGGSRDE